MKFYTQPIDCSSASVLIDARISLLNTHNAQALAVDAFAVCIEHIPYYLENSSPIPLIALIYLQRKSGSLSIQVSFLPSTTEHIQILKIADEDLAWLKAYTAIHQSPWLNLSAPLLLEPVAIPKPWGQEIWFTGIETRGQSRVSDGRFSIPLPWMLELFPQQEPLTLLKILDPLPDENLGNLYFELHEQKQEVYIVTHVDPQAWPEGVGQIQMGFCQQKRKEFSSDDEFKQAYLKSVNDYKNMRHIIDESLDKLQARAHRDRTSLYQDFSASVENQLLIESEYRLRQAMNAFIYHHPLRVGDVVKVPCNTPHSLQHGVRVVEFQTPVYERKILSFGQKVLTQNDWDTQEAMAIAQVDAAHLQAPELIASSVAYQLERIVNFDDFQVQRLITQLPLETQLTVDANTLIMLIKGSAGFVSFEVENAGNHADVRRILPGEAYLVPEGVQGQRLIVDVDSIVLLAMPNTASWSDLG